MRPRIPASALCQRKSTFRRICIFTVQTHSPFQASSPYRPPYRIGTFMVQAFSPYWPFRRIGPTDHHISTRSNIVRHPTRVVVHLPPGSIPPRAEKYRRSICGQMQIMRLLKFVFLVVLKLTSALYSFIRPDPLFLFLHTYHVFVIINVPHNAISQPVLCIY